MTRDDFPRRARLKDATPVRLRLIGPADSDALRAGFEQLSLESRYWRFFTPVARLSETMLHHFTDTDEHNHIAVGAFRIVGRGRDEPVIVGVARCVRFSGDPSVAEVAVTVIDDLQRQGLGTLLLRALARAARQCGIRRFRFYTLPGNFRLQHLMRKVAPVSHVACEADAGTMYLTFEIVLPDGPRGNSRHRFQRKPHPGVRRITPQIHKVLRLMPRSAVPKRRTAAHAGLA